MNEKKTQNETPTSCPCGDPNCAGEMGVEELLDKLFAREPEAAKAAKAPSPDKDKDKGKPFNVDEELRKALRNARIDAEVERRLRTDVRWSLMDGKVTAVILDDNGLDCFVVSLDLRGVPQFKLNTRRYDMAVAVTNEYDMPLLDAVLQAVGKNEMPAVFRDGKFAPASSVKEGK